MAKCDLHRDNTSPDSVRIKRPAEVCCLSARTAGMLRNSIPNFQVERRRVELPTSSLRTTRSTN